MQTETPILRRKRPILVICALVVVGWVLWSTRGALVPFAVGGVIAYLLAPVVRFIEQYLPRKGKLGSASRPMAIVATYLLALAVLGGVGAYLVPPMIDETTRFIDALPSYWEDVRREGSSMLTLYENQVPLSVRQHIQENLSALGSEVTSAIRATLMVTVGAVSTIIGVAAGLALLPLWLFYVLKDERRGLSWFYGIWPADWRDDVRAIVRMVDEVLAAYIRGQLFLGVVIGVVTGVAMWLIGIQPALVLGLVAGVLELIPVLGPWLAFVVAALVTVATDPSRIWLVALAFLAIQQLENTLLVPKIQGDAVRLHPAVIMILLVIGGSLWGLWGMVVVVPLAAIVRDIFVYLYDRAEVS